MSSKSWLMSFIWFFNWWRFSFSLFFCSIIILKFKLNNNLIISNYNLPLFVVNSLWWRLSEACGSARSVTTCSSPRNSEQAQTITTWVDSSMTAGSVGISRRPSQMMRPITASTDQVSSRLPPGAKLLRQVLPPARAPSSSFRLIRSASRTRHCPVARTWTAGGVVTTRLWPLWTRLRTAWTWSSCAPSALTTGAKSRQRRVKRLSSLMMKMMMSISETNIEVSQPWYLAVKFWVDKDCGLCVESEVCFW